MGNFHLLGVERPGAWGIAVAIVHLVPYVGAAVFVSGRRCWSRRFSFTQSRTECWSAAVGLGLSALIGVVFQTWLSGRGVRMNTVAVFVSLMVWGWLWGLPGLLLATPLTVCSQGGLPQCCRFALARIAAR